MLFIARTGYTGEDGFEILMPADTRSGGVGRRCAAAGVRPCGLGARDTLRLEAGMNLYGQDMDETRRRSRPGSRWTVDLASRARFRRQGGARGHAAAQRSSACCCSTPGGVLRAHQEVRTLARRRRDHQRHVQSHARQVDRARARSARASAPGDVGAGRGARQATCRRASSSRHSCATDKRCSMIA